MKVNIIFAGFFIFIFGLVGIVIFGELLDLGQGPAITDCYDERGNKIIGLQCETIGLELTGNSLAMVKFLSWLAVVVVFIGIGFMYAGVMIDD